MTTLVHPTPPLAAAGARPFPQIDLPSGPSPQPAAAPADPVPRRTGLLTWLLAGTAVTGVLGVIGAGVVTVLLRSSHPAQPTGDWVGLPQAVSPQHAPVQPSQPAPARPTPNAPAPAGTGSPPVPAAAVPATTPTPTPSPSTMPRSGADDLRALKQSGPYAPPAPHRPATPAAAAVAAASPTQVLPAHPPAAAQPDANAASAADPASLAGTLTNPDPGAAPAPQVLIDMVTALASDIAQEQKGDAEMHQQIESLLRDTDHRLSEFDRRLSVVEASPSPALAKTGPGRASAKPASADAFSDMRAALSATPPPGGRRYEIRAASPGVAVLGTLDGTPAVVEIAVGDQVPGYGRVNAIGQKGHAWAVLCEHGTIQ